MNEISEYQSKSIPELEVYGLDKTVREKYSKLITGSGILKWSPVTEVWTSNASNKALSYYSHGIFRYFGKFPPPIARYLIKEYTKKNSIVLDPMCGSGTTGLESLLLGRKALCVDINPLATLLSRVKVTRIDKQEFLLKLNEVVNSTNKTKSRSIFPLKGLRDPDHWFLGDTRVSLSQLRRSILSVDASQEIKDALMIAFLSIVRRVSRATTQQGRLFLDVETAEEDALPFFQKKAESMAESLSQLPINKNIEVMTGSIIDSIPIKGRADLIICHPPYFNSYKYSGVNSLELAWLDIDHADIRKHEVRESFKVGKPEKVHEYVEDMKDSLLNLSKYLSRNGILALMIGDTVIRGNYIPVTQMLIEQISHVYRVDKSAIRIPKFTEASWAASMRRRGGDVGISLCDLIVILKKK